MNLTFWETLEDITHFSGWVGGVDNSQVFPTAVVKQKGSKRAEFLLDGTVESGT